MPALWPAAAWYFFLSTTVVAVSFRQVWRKPSKKNTCKRSGVCPSGGCGGRQTPPNHPRERLQILFVLFVRPEGAHKQHKKVKKSAAKKYNYSIRNCLKRVSDSSAARRLGMFWDGLEGRCPSKPSSPQQEMHWEAKVLQRTLFRLPLLQCAKVLSILGMIRHAAFTIHHLT